MLTRRVAFGEQDAVAAGDGRDEVTIRGTGPAAQGHAKGTHTHLDAVAPLELETLSRTQVNPDIRGGLVVEIGDRTIDLSVSSKMAKMNKLLTDTL